MRSVVVRKAGDLSVEERPDPRPRPGQVLLNITHGGICGSDLHYYQHGANGEFAISEPLTLGHEIAGVVAEDPSGELTAGTPVTVHPATPCGHCRECDSGLAHVCRHCRYLGSAAHVPHTQGGFSEQLVVRSAQVRVLPEGLTPARAVLAEPLAVALHGLARAGRVRGARVLVSGAGPIGVLVAGAARAAGADQVCATDLLEFPLRLAERAGADSTVRIGHGELPSEHFDIAIEASGAPAALGGVLAAVRRAGTVVQLGMLPAGPAGVALAACVGKEIDLRGSFRFDAELDEAVALLSSTDRFDSVITHAFPLERAAEAMETAADPAVSGKVVLRVTDDA
jgi:L-idonate 5-dehydrogenase